MTICRAHRRVFHPGGDPARREPHWYPLEAHVLKWAIACVRVFPEIVQIEEAQCDRCPEKHERPIVETETVSKS